MNSGNGSIRVNPCGAAAPCRSGRCAAGVHHAPSRVHVDSTHPATGPPPPPPPSLRGCAGGWRSSHTAWLSSSCPSASRRTTSRPDACCPRTCVPPPRSCLPDAPAVPAVLLLLLVLRCNPAAGAPRMMCASACAASNDRLGNPEGRFSQPLPPQPVWFSERRPPRFPPLGGADPCDGRPGERGGAHDHAAGRAALCPGPQLACGQECADRPRGNRAHGGRGRARRVRPSACPAGRETGMP